MSRLVDVDKLISSLNGLIESGMTGNKVKAVLKFAIQIADAQPTVDAVEIVRCKDCKYYFNSYEKCGLIDTRLHFFETDKVWTEDGFCSWGERREDADT